MRKIASFIYFRIMGWKLMGKAPDLDKCVIIVVPHTSWVDFPLGLLVRKILNLEVNYIGKKSLFSGPFGWFFRWTGGAPVDQHSNQDTVAQVIRLFREKEQFRLALAPEGTRKKVLKWRTGFYHMALGAGVPIVMIAFDYGKKQVRISDPVVPTGDPDKDISDYMTFYKGVRGKVRREGE
ncbi:1-acyl-sn-glycerol-3-phosphate acyltransferase [Muriicola marianensis]|uniref:Acyltransferase n=1 Tax=Muriicola marianensis TaxID=1324801 RepID=A0ABQ1QSQ2_9FLAO|nr:1-acyl-sn-glycerol-3-phosphate acyltransferase [Muriicola marianensis]GGD41887.1 acyltransferase [Muriicola marianensis]